jgi:hypothetical protein
MAMADNDRHGNAFDLSAMTALSSAYQKKILEITQTNAQAAFEFGKALMSCRNPEDFIRQTQEYTQKQVENFQKQSRELMELARKSGS